MNHSEIQQKLLALYDGPLSEKERPLVEQHLVSCPDCRRVVGQWKRASEVLFTKPSFSEADEDAFVNSVMSYVREIPAPQSFSWGVTFRWLVPVAGSALLAAWAFFTVLSDTKNLDQQASVETFFSEEQPDYHTSLGAMAASRSDRLVHQVVLNY
jgi:anti-sigma factor RsiW